MLQFLPKPQ